MPFVDTLIIETSGRGWPYSVVFVEGWWRDLAELALDDEKRVLSFLQRRGDPLGQLAPDGKQVITYDWRHLKAVLERAAVAWDKQPDATGVSHFRQEKLRSAEHMFDRAAHPVPTDSAATGWADELGVSLFRHLPVSPRPDARAPICAPLPPLRWRKVLICAAAITVAAGSPSTAPTPAGAQAHAVQPPPTKGRHPMASFRKIRTRKGAIRWQSRWRVPGANGRLQDRARNFATWKQAASPRRADARDRTPRRRRPAPT